MKKMFYLQFLMSYAMFFEATFINEYLRHIFRLKLSLVDLVLFCTLFFSLSLT